MRLAAPFFNLKPMNLLLYGVPAGIARRIADRYSLKMARTLAGVGEPDTLLIIPPMESPRQLLAFYNEMLARESEIDAVIVCDPAACEAANTVRYGSPPDKFFTLGPEEDEAELEYAISRIVESKLGLVCAHEGL